MNNGNNRAELIAKKIEDLGSGLTSLSLVAIGSQSVWPVPGFVMPQPVLKAAFVCAIAGFALRQIAKPIAGIAVLFLPSQPDATTTGAGSTATAAGSLSTDVGVKSTDTPQNKVG